MEYNFAMWIKYLLAAAYLIIIIRLIVFVISSASFDEKMGKAKGWFIGLFLLTLSWFFISTIFGIDSSMKIGTAEHIIEEPDQEDNNNTSVPINIGN